MIIRGLVFLHRWLGVALCLLFLLWFPSGIVMMYWDYPDITAADRLERAPALEASTIRLSPLEAASRAGLESPRQVRLATFDGRPVYRFGPGPGDAIVYADTGDEQIDVSRAMVDRIASAWSGQAPGAATVLRVDEVDQWTLQIRIADVAPLWKYSWPDGQQVYVSQASGEVLQYTTTASRWGAYLGAIPHWLYFTPLRKHGRQWSRVVVWSSAAGALAALLGLVVGVWRYSPAKRYRYLGRPTSLPYRGQKRWHAALGLLFGLGALTWAFSGLLSMEPFPLESGGPPGAGRRSVGIVQALRGATAALPAFEAKPPRQALAALGAFRAKQLELTSFAGEPVYLATIAPGDTRVVPIDGAPLAGFDPDRIIAVLSSAAASAGGVDISVLERYDRYYLDRHRQRPLPVILAELHDGDRTRYYIDPKTARVVQTYSARGWMRRWLYHGLHSLDFPWLYDHRPLWDIVVMTFMVGETALVVTSLVLAWRVLGRKLSGRPADRAPAAIDDALATD